MKGAASEDPVTNSVHSLTLPTVVVSELQLRDTAALLASFASLEDSEGVVYWFGCDFGKRAVITTLIVPNADTRDGCVSTSAAVNAEALSAIVGTPLVLLGQAHSHPHDWVDHSWVDNKDTFSQFPGALSVVVPFYGREGFELVRCGVYRYLDDRYQRIKAQDLEKHLQVVPGIRDFRHSRRRVGGGGYV